MEGCNGPARPRLLGLKKPFGRLLRDVFALAPLTPSHRPGALFESETNLLVPFNANIERMITQRKSKCKGFFQKNIFFLKAAFFLARRPIISVTMLRSAQGIAA